MKYLWQDSDYVLSWFSRKRRSALKAYRQYVEQGASQGRRPELVGDGLVNSPGKSAEKFDFDGMQKKPLADRRILGGEDFAKKILKGSEHEVKYQVPLVQMREKVQSIIEEKCRGENIRVEELRMGARRRPIGEVRSEIAWQLVNDLGIPVVETARQLGVSPSAISKILQRKGTK